VLDKLPLSLGNATMDQIKNYAKILAEAMPPLSGPAGYYAAHSLPDTKCFNLDNPPFKNANLWPTSRPGKSNNQQVNQRWLHGDYKDAPYLLTHKFYETIVELAN